MEEVYYTKNQIWWCQRKLTTLQFFRCMKTNHASPFSHLNYILHYLAIIIVKCLLLYGFIFLSLRLVFVMTLSCRDKPWAAVEAVVGVCQIVGQEGVMADLGWEACASGSSQRGLLVHPSERHGSIKPAHLAKEILAQQRQFLDLVVSTLGEAGATLEKASDELSKREKSLRDNDDKIAEE